MESSSESRGWKRDFFTIWTGQAFSLLGSSLAGFALVWWLASTTGSATLLAGATIMMILPQFLLGPLAGALVDRWPRRGVMIAADSLIALFSLGLVVLFALGLAQFWHVYAVMLVRAIGGAFHTPAMQSSTPLMVPQKHLTRVAGLNQTFYGVINMFSPPLAALLLAVMPIQSVLMIDVLTALLAVTPLFFIAIPNPPHQAAASSEKPSVLRNMREGLRFVWGWTGLMVIMIMASLLNCINVPTLSFTPLLVTRHFGLGALQLGWMETAAGLGAIAGGLLLSSWGGFKNRMVSILLFAIVAGCGTLLCGLAPVHAFPLALLGNLVSPLASTFISGLIFALVQTIVPPEMQGRVFSLLLSAAAALAPLGLLIAGPLVDAVGVQFWYVMAGTLTVCTGLTGFLIPALMRLDKPPAGEGAALATTGD